MYHSERSEGLSLVKRGNSARSPRSILIELATLARISTGKPMALKYLSIVLIICAFTHALKFGPLFACVAGYLRFLHGYWNLCCEQSEHEGEAQSRLAGWRGQSKPLQ